MKIFSSMCRKKDYLGLLIFFPIYFGLSGLYKSDLPKWGNMAEKKTIFPLAFFSALFLIFIMLFYYLYNRNAKMPRLALNIILLYGSIFTMSILIGVTTQKFFIIVAYGQVASGITGVFLATWFYKIKKLDFIEATGFISKLYLINALLNFVYEFIKQGWVLYQSRLILPGTPFWGIYHVFVYYPMIFSLVMVFAIPYWKNKLNFVCFYLLYLFVLVYIWMYQVRAALLSYLIIMFLYVLFYERNKIISMLVVFWVTIGMIYLVSFTDLLQNSRLSDLGGSIENVGGRDWVYAEFFSNFVEDPAYILKGALFDAFGNYDAHKKLESSEDIANQVGQRNGYHNQYFEAIADAGILFLLLLLGCLYSIIRCIRNYIKHPGLIPMQYFSFWRVIIFVQMAIDLSFQVPLKVTNPALIYWFYWVGVAFYAQNLRKIERNTLCR